MRLEEYAARVAGRSPADLAIRLGDRTLRYGELVSGARRLARLLGAVGVGAGDRVALLSPKTPEAILAMHAVLEAGAAYVPIDPASPAARLRMTLGSAEPVAVIATAAMAPLLVEAGADGGLDGTKLICLDEPGSPTAAFDHGPPDWAGLEDGPLPTQPAAELAHILFTSGSTGTPKGVQITHAMVVSFIEWALSHFGTAAGERVSGHPPLHFDLSTFDIYATLAAGAELHLVPASANLSPRSLADFIRDAELDQWFSVPSTLAFMSAAGVIAERDFPSLKRVLFCGEAMPTPVLAEWMRRVPQATYTNLYGPTETTIASSHHEITEPPEDESAPIPIGVACAGEKLHVLGSELESREPGESGEIYISGDGLSPGYWRDSAKTDAAFVRRPGDGLRLYRTGDLGSIDREGRFMCAGRVDSQIKHRGFRIELGEIEAALNATGDLAETAVVAIPSEGFEGTRICCAFVPRGGDLSAAELARALRSSLPAYMIPTEWSRRDRLPKNTSGKIDRKALRESFTSSVSTGRG